MSPHTHVHHCISPPTHIHAHWQMGVVEVYSPPHIHMHAHGQVGGPPPHTYTVTGRWVDRVVAAYGSRIYSGNVGRTFDQLESLRAKVL